MRGTARCRLVESKVWHVVIPWSDQTPLGRAIDGALCTHVVSVNVHLHVLILVVILVVALSALLVLVLLNLLLLVVVVTGSDARSRARGWFGGGRTSVEVVSRPHSPKEAADGGVSCRRENGGKHSGVSAGVPRRLQGHRQLVGLAGRAREETRGVSMDEARPVRRARAH